MSGILNIAISGLNDATLRVANATRNIVNASSTGKLPTNPGDAATSYLPRDVVTLSVDSDNNNLGVTSVTRPRDPSYVTAYDPSSPDANAQGLVAAPNVDLNAELIAAKEGQISYAVNAKVIKIASEMEKSLLDALS
ncbi:MAG: flagellar basal body rod protein FlgC [Bdellovibrionales bacterium]